MRGYATPAVFASRVHKRLKKKEIAKPHDPSIRKYIEGKDLAIFLGGG
jgi:alkaline phosphatase